MIIQQFRPASGDSSAWVGANKNPLIATWKKEIFRIKISLILSNILHGKMKHFLKNIVKSIPWKNKQKYYQKMFEIDFTENLFFVKLILSKSL